MNLGFGLAQAARETLRIDALADLARVYEPEVTTVVWRRALPPSLGAWLDGLRRGTALQVVTRYRPGVDDPAALAPWLDAHHPAALLQQWRDDLDLLAHVFADLFETSTLGLRLSTVTTHCQRFHVDRITARLVTTYAGPGTEWVDDADARRSLLGHAYQGAGDANDAIVPDPTRIHRLRPGEVGVLKGDAWPGREGRGCVHRSPPHRPGEAPRILLTLEALEG